MIKFLKKIFGKKEKIKNIEPVEVEQELEKVVEKVVEKEPEFITKEPEEIYLVNQGFKFSLGSLVKKKDDSSISYNLEKKTMTINKDGGTIVLMTGGQKDKIERFYKKYFI